MTAFRSIVMGGVALMGVLCFVAVNRAADEMEKPEAAAATNSPMIRGNYILVSRDLPDGKQIKSPEIVGMLTYTSDRRNFNVYWQQDGKPVSISSISMYTLSSSEYTEDCQYYAENGMAGAGPKYQTTKESGKSPVKIDGDKIELQLPLHGEPKVVFDADGMTATKDGAFVDHWKKVD